MKKSINFGIVGLGHIGLRHAEMMLDNENINLIGVCDIDPEKLKKAEKFGIPLFEKVEEMLEQIKDIDVLTVATPNGSHAAHALLGLSAGKHVVIEKPMALKSTDCNAVIELAHQKSKEVFCIMQNRYSPPSKWLKQLVDKGVLGEIYMVQVNCLWNRDERYYSGQNWRGSIDGDGGTLFTQFSHFIDLLYWVFGDIENIQSKFRDFNHKNLTNFEDSGFVFFDFSKGGCGQITYSSSVWDKNMESSISVIAENGSLKIGGQYMNEVEYCHVKNYEMPTLEKSQPANDYGNYKGSAANHRYVYDNICNVLNSKESITTNALEGKKVVEIIERIYLENKYLNKLNK